MESGRESLAWANGGIHGEGYPEPPEGSRLDGWVGRGRVAFLGGVDRRPEVLQNLTSSRRHPRESPIRDCDELEGLAESFRIHRLLPHPVLEVLGDPLKTRGLAGNVAGILRLQELDVVQNLVYLGLGERFDPAQEALSQHVVHGMWGVGGTDTRKIATTGRPGRWGAPGLDGAEPPHYAVAMAFFPLRPVPLPDATERRYTRWLGDVDSRLDDPGVNRSDLCRQILTGLYQPALAGENPDDLDPTARILVDQFDPRNVVLEPEYYHETDPARYARVKPLLWLWEMFDRSPAGENVPLGVGFRRLLARRVFRSCGRNFKAFPFMRVTFGYNLEVGDDVVIHRHVLLDDRGGIRIGNGASISDFANVYSHSHDIVDGREVNTPQTIIGDRVRITYHATILAGTTVGHDSMVGAQAVLTRDTDPRWVYVGVPARPIREKSAEALAARPARQPDPLASPDDPDPR